MRKKTHKEYISELAVVNPNIEVYCQNNNIKLLEIPYYVDIEKELNNFLFI